VRTNKLSSSLRALDEAHQRYLHDLATDIEAAHEKGREVGRDEGVTIGEAKERNLWATDKIETLIRYLTKNFGEVTPNVREKLYAIHDLDVLGQLTEAAWDCESLDEFESALRK